MGKRCFVCNVVKSLSDFYPHPNMGDGHLGKCKDCSRLQALKRYRMLRDTNPRWVEKERQRGREKARRVYRNSYRQRRDPLKRAARVLLGNAVRGGKLTRPKLCDACGKRCRPTAHHENYERPLEVEWLCTSCHGRRNRRPMV